MDKTGTTDTPEEVTIKEETFKVMIFWLRDDESIYGELFERLRKSAFVGRYEYPETIDGTYELLVRT